MTALIQRVLGAKVSVGAKTISDIDQGMLILLGIRKGDTEDKAQRLATRCTHLRIFEDPNGKFNLSIKDINGAALVVSLFTLLADTTHGRRPSFTDAEEPGQSKKLYESFIQALIAGGIPTKAGAFGERMVVSLENNGPVTIILEE